MSLYLGKKLKEKRAKHQRRKIKTNTKIKSHYPEARLIINRSNKYIQAQVIDQTGKVIAMVSDKSTQWGTKSENAKNAGILLSKDLKKAKIEKVSFDRNGFLYHGRIAAFADWLRESGIEI